MATHGQNEIPLAVAAMDAPTAQIIKNKMVARSACAVILSGAKNPCILVFETTTEILRFAQDDVLTEPLQIPLHCEEGDGHTIQEIKQILRFAQDDVQGGREYLP
jgi:hypothetical protein